MNTLELYASIQPRYPELRGQVAIVTGSSRRIGKGIAMRLDIGAAVAFLASPDAAFITGQILYVDGGLTAQLTPRHQPI